MKLVPTFLTALLVGLCLYNTRAQTNSDLWMRVQSDDGEFSIEVPKSHRFFFNADGFKVGSDRDDIPLKNMYMLNAVIDGSLISFEMYDGGKGAMESLYENDAFAKEGRKISELRTAKIKGKQIINKTEKYYSVRWFFNTKKHVYVLTTAARTGETPAMRRFLDSLAIAGDANKSTDSAVRRFSSLKLVDVAIESNDKPETLIKSSPPTAIVDPAVKPYVMIRAARASYVWPARNNGETGEIRLKLELAADGFVPKVTIKKLLPQGLLRQALFAAIRVKFLPKEKDGVPISTSVTMEYGFYIR